MSVINKLRPIFIKPKGIHTSTVIFLHGSGDTGQGLREWLNMIVGKEFSFENTKVVYPTAPQRPYTPMNGGLSTVWFDRKQISNLVSEDLSTVDPMCEDMKVLIEHEVASGIPPNKIIIGGFSMGGGLAFHVGYRYFTNLGGVFALSSFLNEGSLVYETIKGHKHPSSLPPLFQCHGTIDPIVFFTWGKKTSEELTKLGIQVTFTEYKTLYHEMKKEQIASLQEWILSRFSISRL